jgi:cell division protein FtsQ
MRRPPPLPPVTPVSTERGRVEPDRVEPDEAEPDRIEPETLAPVTPLAPSGIALATMQRPSGLTDATVTRTDAAAGDAGVDIAAAEDAIDPVRLRHVWSAARARRKALRAEMRRFTGRQRRRRLVWVGSLAAVVLLVLATLGAAYSPLFAVEQIRIVGADQLDTAAVQDALSGQMGTPLPLVDESAVKAALVGFPLVESYSLEARPPHELIVRIVERTPVGVIETRAGFTLVDAAGVALSTTQTPAAGRPLLSVEGGTDSAAFEAVGHVVRSLPDSILTQITAVSATTPDDVTLTLGGSNAQVVWGSDERSADKALRLEKMMISRPPATVSVYDVSSPDAVVVR